MSGRSLYIQWFEKKKITNLLGMVLVRKKKLTFAETRGNLEERLEETVEKEERT